ncbi:MAG: hypothetical protein A3F74_10575 [Betaproteobacteria bacterium RIFCSPLOWO2_12_FULL_62_58]|nr:MAG: hypothetical protein A3F74_10575 [Betaproteobacteria bacterium RIFCSPLOWO2_12_FULL_62_58]
MANKGPFSRAYIQHFELVIYPEVNGATTRKQAKEFLSTLAGKNISGQMPEPAHWAEYVT